MTTYYYDVVVLGMELGPLAAGAVLAKRGFRVLVLGGGQDRDRYPCFGYDFLRRPFVVNNAEGAPVRRVLDELGIAQLWQYARRETDPVWQILLPDARMNIPRDLRRISREVKREDPDSAAGLDDAIDAVGRIHSEIGKLFVDDFVLPPETFFERREFARIEVQNPFRLPHGVPGCGRAALIPEFMMLPTRMSAGGVSELPPIVRYRNLGGWIFDCAAFTDGRDGVRKLLTDQISGQGGDVHPSLRATEIVVKRGTVTGVRVEGRDEVTGCRVVLSPHQPQQLGGLVKPGDWTKRFRGLVTDEEPPAQGYALNLGMDAEVVPEGLADTAFLYNGDLYGDGLLRIERIPQRDETKAALHVFCVVPPERLGEMLSGVLRDRILDRMRRLIPFLDNYLRVIHSPYDGAGPLDLTGTAGGEAPPVPRPEDIEHLYLPAPKPESPLGIAALPHRTGIKGLILSGEQVVRGLGLEGEMLAAWGAARIVRRMDPRRERLVKSMRAKVEL